MNNKLENNITEEEVEKLANKCLHCGGLPIVQHYNNCGWLFECKCGISTNAFETPDELLKVWNSVYIVINNN